MTTRTAARPHVRRLRTIGLAVLAMLASACGSDSITDPRFEPEINNVPGSFQLQASGLSRVTQTLSYNWQNSATTANIDQSGVITAGTATLRLRDAGGTVVYTGDLTDTGSFTTSAGAAGTWTIQLVLSGVSGNLNFRVQTP